jgi:colanic acid/amylovoran biosynthesis glycosyltransferase
MDSTQAPSRRVSLCIVAQYLPVLTETFIKQHLEELPAEIVLLHDRPPKINDRPVLSFPSRVLHKALRIASGRGLERETTLGYLKGFREHHVDAVLAEYGESGVQCREACCIAHLPLIVHFHGYDASHRLTLSEHGAAYMQMFRDAAAVIVVSRAMQQKLIGMGAPAAKVHYNPYGVDCDKFAGADPAQSAPVLIAVGRFIEKKAPHLTIAAFAAARQACPDARLVMIGSGPLLDQCQELSRQLRVDDAVTFLGDQPPSVVQREMRGARCFVQHSVEASSGDSEGTPVAILEAGATGLPVVSTRHGGIPDVVLEGTTGFLVDEGDVDAMASAIVRLLKEPALAGKMGAAARQNIQEHFARELSLKRLWSIIESCLPRA